MNRFKLTCFDLNALKQKTIISYFKYAADLNVTQK